MDVKTIKQKYKNDCTLCCLSMLLRVDYKYLKDKYFNRHNFRKYGVCNSYSMYIIKKERRACCTNVGCLHAKNSSGILSVESINKKYSWHSIFWDKKTKCVRDPSNKKKIANLDGIRVYGFEHIRNRTCPK